MTEEQDNQVSSIARDILGSIWSTEKSTWKTPSRLGLIGGVIFLLIAGFLGNALYGLFGLVSGAVLGVVAGWLLLTLVFYFFLSTASFFN